MEYVGLEIDVRPDEGDYTVHLHRPVGGDAAAGGAKVNGQQLRGILETLEDELERDVGGRVRDASPPAGSGPAPRSQDLAELSKELSRLLLPEMLGKTFENSLLTTSLERKGLRISLSVPSELDSLPWEMLWDPRRNDFACLNAETPVVRYHQANQPQRGMAVTLPLRVLVLCSQPIDQPRLDAPLEMKHLAEAMDSLHGLADAKSVPGASWNALTDALREADYHVLHFIGHGGLHPETGESAIVLAREDGSSHYIAAADLGRTLGEHSSIKLVVLNSCEGARADARRHFLSAASALMQQGIPCVLAMRYPITDAAAVEFARIFYRSLAGFNPVEEALNRSRLAIKVNLGRAEWATPALFLRAADGVLFEKRDQTIARDDSGASSEKLRARRASPSQAQRQGQALLAQLGRVGRLAQALRAYVTNYEYAYETMGKWSYFSVALQDITGDIRTNASSVTAGRLNLVLQTFDVARSRYGGDLSSWARGIVPPCDQLDATATAYAERMDELDHSMQALAAMIDELGDLGDDNENAASDLASLRSLTSNGLRVSRKVVTLCQEICRVLLDEVAGFVRELQMESRVNDEEVAP